MKSLNPVLFLSLLLSTSSYALPFQPGEQLTYSLKWSIFTAGHMTATIQEPIHDKDGNVVYPIVAVAKSTKAVNAIFPLTETLTSSWDQGLFSRAFELHGREGSEQKDQTQSNNYQTHEIIFNQVITDLKKKKAPSKKAGVYPLANSSQDILSSLYFIRTANLPGVGQEYRFPTTWEGEPYTAVIKKTGTDKVKFDGRKIVADVYVLDLYKDGKVDIGGTKVWISQESNRLILEVEAKLSFGSIHIELDSVK